MAKPRSSCNQITRRVSVRDRQAGPAERPGLLTGELVEGEALDFGLEQAVVVEFGPEMQEDRPEAHGYRARRVL